MPDVGPSLPLCIPMLGRSGFFRPKRNQRRKAPPAIYPQTICILVRQQIALLLSQQHRKGGVGPPHAWLATCQCPPPERLVKTTK